MLRPFFIKSVKEKRKEQEERARLERVEDEKRRTLNAGGFKLYLDCRNRFHIYYKDKEFTKGTGLHLDVLSEGGWYGSSDSLPKIERPSQNEMAVCFAHNKLPLNQKWRISFNEKGVLIWDVRMEIKEMLRIDRRNAHIFLSRAYSDWVSPLELGVFPCEFNNLWQAMNSTVKPLEFIAVKSASEDVPGVIFKHPKESNFSLVLQNTDYNLSSRAVGLYCEDNKEFYSPGVYPCLDAVIELYPDKSVVENLIKSVKEKKCREEERRRLAEEKKRREEERERWQELRRENIEKSSIKLEKDMAFLPPDKSKGSGIYLYGDSAQLHDKIASCPNGDFQRTIDKVRAAVNNGVRFKIGVSRFNFFRLNRIIQFYSLLMNRRLDLRSLSLPLFPVKDLHLNFMNYIKELNARIGSKRFGFFLKDEKLPEILRSVSAQADQYNEKDLLRLLGVITEYPFIGPQTLVLDTYHKCNTNCIHCWLHTPRRKILPPALDLKMEFSLFKKIIDDAAALLCDEIILQGDGEPLLDSRFIEMVTYARNKGLKVLFFTNAILLDEKKAREIVGLEINEIFCSLPAGTDKTYCKVNPGHSAETFRRIVDNLKRLIWLRGRFKSNKPLLQMTHVIHNLNYHELDRMAQIDEYVGADKVRFYLARLDENIEFLKLSPVHLGAIKRSLKKIAPLLKRSNIELQENIYFQLENYDPETGYWSKNEFLKSGCPVGWFFGLILAKGEVSMCCHLRIVDRLKDKPLAEIWNSEDYNMLRINAKYLEKNKNVVLPNGVKLYDEFCNHCDTHQVILRINDLLKQYNLDKFK